MKPQIYTSEHGYKTKLQIAGCRLQIFKKSACVCVCLWLIFLFSAAHAQTLAPGAPGKDAQWATAGKQAIGTSASLESKVWFTLAEGVMTEVYYPDVTVANVHLLQFIAVDFSGNTETERDDTVHEIKVLRNDSLSFQQINTAKSGKWKITKTYTADAERNTILIDVKIEKDKDYGGQFYVYYDPSLNNTGMHDTAWTKDGALLSQDGDKSSALVFFEKEQLPQDRELGYPGFRYTNNGFLGTSGGTDYYTRQFKSELEHPNAGSGLRDSIRAENGNVTQTGSIFTLLELGSRVYQKQFTLALGFGKTPDEALKTAKASLQKGFAKCQAEYEKGWSDYVKTLPKVEPKYQAQFNMAAMVLKAQEDKTVRGANVASLTIPWGGGANANEDVGGGYHLVWSRDLYEVVTAYMALGDTAAANRALDFLFNVQQKADGSFPQNSRLDGKGGWGSLQLDEVAYPLILAYQLKRFDKSLYENHVKRAADFLVKTGPKTVQERWEEKSGYSPSTIAAEIAGLVCAADIARRNGDAASANLYLKTADDWAANVEKWTATTNGKYGDGNYYVRLTANGKPDAGEKIALSNSSGTFQENEIVDAGFLELVRLGIKPPDDPLIVKSLKVVDEVLKVNTPNGEGFYRYNHDGYGEMDDGRRWNWDGKYTGKGRLWALLSGERGEYELAMQKLYLDKINNRFPNDNKDSSKKYPPAKPSIDYLIAAQKRLNSMAKFANEGLMIPEQVWDKAETPQNIDKQFIPELKFGEGTGSATPLAWSMAQYIRLAVNLQAGRNLETPDVVYNRYVLGKKDLSETVITSGVPQFLPRNSNLPDLSNLKATELCSSQWQRYVIEKQKDFFMKLKKNPTFWKCQNGNVLAIFIYTGSGGDVRIGGDFNNWKPTEEDIIEAVSGDNISASVYGKVKFAWYEFKSTARVEYKLIVDGNWITDPLNPNKIDNGVGGENSVLTMPEYKATKWTQFPIINNSQGKLIVSSRFEELDLQTKNFGTRKIKVYLPGEYDLKNKSLRFPVLYLQTEPNILTERKPQRFKRI